MSDTGSAKGQDDSAIDYRFVVESILDEDRGKQTLVGKVRPCV